MRGIDETLQRELDTVQAVYFPPEVERYSSNALFEPTILTLCNTANDTLNEDLCENPEPGDRLTEVSEELIHKFLSVSCQCSLGPNEQPCSSLFTEATVFELRSQCLELTSDQLDMLILGRLDGHTKERVDIVPTTLLGVIKFDGKHFCFFTAYPKRGS